MKHLVFHQADLKNNVALIKERAGGASIYAVLTGDAHGAGLLDMAKFLREEGIGRFAVSEPKEAVSLRRAGMVEEELLMLRSTIDPEELEILIDHNVVCTIGSYDTGIALNGLAEKHHTIVEAHVQIDTGMGYGGFLVSEPEKILSMYRYMPNVALSGLYTQIYTGNQAQTVDQLEAFQGIREIILQAGFEPGIVHAAGSDAFLRYDFAKLDAVRVGSAWLGRCRNAQRHGLISVGEGEATLSEIHWLPRGHTIGNQKQVSLRRATQVGLLPVGYQNGLSTKHRSQLGFWAGLSYLFATQNIAVYVNGQRVPILGQVGALETLLDITDMKVGMEDIVTFEIDPQHARGMPRTYR